MRFERRSNGRAHLLFNACERDQASSLVLKAEIRSLLKRAGRQKVTEANECPRVGIAFWGPNVSQAAAMEQTEHHFQRITPSCAWPQGCLRCNPQRLAPTSETPSSAAIAVGSSRSARMTLFSSWHSTARDRGRPPPDATILVENFRARRVAKFCHDAADPVGSVRTSSGRRNPLTLRDDCKATRLMIVWHRLGRVRVPPLALT